MRWLFLFLLCINYFVYARVPEFGLGRAPTVALASCSINGTITQQARCTSVEKRGQTGARGADVRPFDVAALDRKECFPNPIRYPSASF